MLLARVTGTLVATQKHHKLEGAKLLFVQPLTLEDTPRGPELLAVDGVGAGVHEKVLIVLEGRSVGARGEKGGDVLNGRPHAAAAPRRRRCCCGSRHCGCQTSAAHEHQCES